MDDYDTMVHTARPFVETIIRQAQDLHRKKKKELEKSWSLIDDELRSVENGDHEVLHVLQDAHDKVIDKFLPRIEWDVNNLPRITTAYSMALDTVRAEMADKLREVVTRERIIIDRFHDACTELIDWAIAEYKAVPLLGPSAVYEDVAEYLLHLADIRLTLVPMLHHVIRATLVENQEAKPAVEKARDATQDARDQFPDSVLLLARLLRIPLAVPNRKLFRPKQAQGRNGEAEPGDEDSAQHKAKKKKGKNKKKSKKRTSKSKNKGQREKGRAKGAGAKSKGKTKASHTQRIVRQPTHQSPARRAATAPLGARRQHMTSSSQSIGLDASLSLLRSSRVTRELQSKQEEEEKRQSATGALALPPASKYGDGKFKERTEKYRALPFSPIVVVKGMPIVYGRTKTPYIRTRGETFVKKSSVGYFALPAGVGRTSGPGTFSGATKPAVRAPRQGKLPPTMNVFLPATPGTMRTKRWTWEDTQRRREKEKLKKAQREREARARQKTVAEETLLLSQVDDG